MRGKRVSSTPVRSGGATGPKPRRGVARSLMAGAAVAVGSVAIAACGSSGGGQVVNHATSAAEGTSLYGSLPAAGTPAAKQSTISIGQLSSAVPTWFFPIANGADSGTQNLNLADQLYAPVFFGPNGAVPEDNPSLSLATGNPVPSNGDKTYTFTLKPNLQWSDGKPITTTDVIFGYDLLRAAVDENLSNWGQIVPGQFPQSVTSIKATGPRTIQINLNKAYNPGYFLYNQVQDTNWGLYAMPSFWWNETAPGKHVSDWEGNEKVDTQIYNFLNKQAGDLGTWATNPLWSVNDGPYHLSSFNTTSSAYTLTPNKNYSLSPKAYDTIDYETFTSATAELDAEKSGSLDIGSLDPSELPQTATLKSDGDTVYGGPGFGWFGGIYNFEDKTDDFDKVIAQSYVRGAIQSLVDESAIKTAVYKGAATLLYASVPTEPSSPYAPAAASHPVYPYSTTYAAQVLKAHGWKVVPGGTTTCAKPGTASDECGAGIPAGTPIKFVWDNPPYSYDSAPINESTFLAGAAKKYAGIDIQLQTQSIDFLEQDYDDEIPGDAKYENDWGVNNFGGVFTDYYPTAAGIWTPGGGFNFGDYDDPTTNKLINASEFSGNPSAVKAEVTYEAKNPAVVFFPTQDNLVVANDKVGAQPIFWLALSQQQQEPQFLYLKK